MVRTSMRTRLIVTMRHAFARRYATQHSLFKPDVLFRGLLTARLIDAPGYSMRILVEQTEEDILCHRLEHDFVIHRICIPHPAELPHV